MIAVDVTVAARLHKAGFSFSNWWAVGEDGAVHVVTADGPLGSIRAEGPTRSGAFRAALDQVRALNLES